MVWWIRYLDYPRLQILIAMLVMLVALALLPRTRLGMVGMVALAGACAYDAWILFPYTSIPAPSQVTADSCPADRRFRLLEVNVQMTNRHDHRLLNIVRDAKPDVVWFQETNEWWTQELSSLADTMPYRVDATRPNYFGAHLYSRLELVDPQVHNLTSSANPSVFTGVRLPSGDVVMLYAVHPRPPQTGQSVRERNAQLMATALAARNDSRPHVIAGDLNSVPWEGIVRHTQRVGRFLDPRVGRGMKITWNANSAIFRWPLDHILPGPQFTVVSLQVLPAFGSDHRPYLAVLCVDPTAAARQSPPALRPTDIASAREVVRLGQNVAEKTGYKGRIEDQGS
ncbi:MAG: endonuclease/exonuclease/phosphatase family protein [Acetobacteraceae bacterium]